jgi:large exoprotein involved in heme utilization and adhesion
VPTFEETLSVRGRTPGSDPVSATVTTVKGETRGSVLAVLTADGRRGRRRYRGGGPGRGVVVHVHGDAVAFERV